MDHSRTILWIQVVHDLNRFPTPALPGSGSKGRPEKDSQSQTPLAKKECVNVMRVFVNEGYSPHIHCFVCRSYDCGVKQLLLQVMETGKVS